MSRRLAACWFPGSKSFDRLARVLTYSAHEHLAGWEIRVERIEPMDIRSAHARPGHIWNAQKMAYWADVIDRSTDGDEVVLIDADCAVIHSLDPVWALEFDVAYTIKTSRFPFNSGVVPVRVNERSRRFVAAWWQEQQRMLDQFEHHQKWRAQYGGLNQAALGYALSETACWGAQVVPIPCLEWNCEDSSWSRFDAELTRVLHIKSGLRAALIGTRRVHPTWRRAARAWRAIEARALTARRYGVAT